MGKRSTNTTKSGKFMNPTDQARKEARKKELKKNKKQRQMVRAAVLKGKNPTEIVQELEKIDDMEFNVLAPPPLNDKVLRDKRRKLHETWNRVMRMYEKEDVEQYVELKKLWHSYQNRKHEVVQHFESVKNAQNVLVDEIPLPSLPDGESVATDSIPLPPSFNLQPKSSILKKPSVLESLKPKVCPGVPAGPPPLLDDYDNEEEGGTKADEKTEEKRNKKIRFDDEDEENTDANVASTSEANNELLSNQDSDLVAPGEESGPQVDEIQRKMLLMAGQDVDQYMKEMEQVHRATQAEKSADIENRLSKLEGQGPGSKREPPGPPGGQPPAQQIQNNPARVPPGPPMMMHPQQMQQQQPQQQPPPPSLGLGPPTRPPIMYRPAPPPLRPGMAPPSVRLPPGPPPGRPPMHRMPPGPPPGIPSIRPPRPLMQAPAGMGQLQLRPQGVVSAGPQLNKEATTQQQQAKQQQQGQQTTGGGVIEAKPQMRNLKSDITRFVPTNVKLKREGNVKKKQSDPMQEVFNNPSHPAPQQTAKDDAYAQFMKEMEQMMK